MKKQVLVFRVEYDPDVLRKEAYLVGVTPTSTDMEVAQAVVDEMGSNLTSVGTGFIFDNVTIRLKKASEAVEEWVNDDDAGLFEVIPVMTEVVGPALDHAVLSREELAEKEKEERQ